MKHYLYTAVLINLALLAGINYLGAAPACPDLFTDHQPDGREFKARLKGDEWTHWAETEDGHPIVRNSKTGFWEYGLLKPSVGLAPSGQIVGRDEPFGITKISARELKSTMPESGFKAPLSPARSPVPSRMPALETPFSAPLNITGARKLLVILVNFTNLKVQTTEVDWENEIFGAANSVKAYYDEVSYNQLTITPADETYDIVNNGVISVTLAYNHPITEPSIPDIPNQQLTKDAIIAADPYIDFAGFDTDDNGQITTNELNVMIIVAGYETAYNINTPSPSVWAHKWFINDIAAPVRDGKTVGAYPGGYTQFGELHSNAVATHTATIGVIVHELAHDLGTTTIYMGLPDLYDYTNNSYGVGRWDTMGYGAWNKVSYNGDTPAHFSAWCKWYLGWVTPTQITVPTSNVSFPRTETAVGPDYGIIQILINPNGPEISGTSNGGTISDGEIVGATILSGTGEYFLIENRQKTGYDTALPGAGLLIWHIDETQSNNNNVAQKLVDLEEADERVTGAQLDNQVSSGDAGDPYPGNRLTRIFDDSSQPDSRLYSGANYHVAVTNISNSGAIMTADISVGLPPVLTSPGDKTVYENQILAFTLLGTDPDGDTITYSMTETPTNATLGPSTGNFSWLALLGAYTVTFTATANFSSDSQSILITVLAVTSLPTAPSALTATAISSSEIDLDWTDASADEEGFRIERSPNNVTFTEIATVENDVNSYLDEDLTARTTYYYRVRAYNSSGDSDYSDIDSATTLAVKTTTFGSSGRTRHKSRSKCGGMGLEALVFILLIRHLRRRNPR